MVKDAAGLGLPALEGDAEVGLAGALLARGDPGSAAAHVRRSFALRRRVTSGLGPLRESLARQRDDHVRLVDTAHRVAFALESPAASLGLLELARAEVIVRALGGREAVRSAAGDRSEASVRSGQRLAAARVRYVDAYRDGGVGSARTARAEYEAARDGFQDVLERDQRSRSRNALAMDVAPRPLAEVQASLAPGDALIEYAFVEDRLRALVVRCESARRVDLGPARDVEIAVEDLLADISLRREDLDVAPLRDAIAAPLGLGSEVTRVIVSPDAVLRVAPHALLFGGRPVALVPSASAHVLLAAEARGRRGEGVLALGDPRYGEHPSGEGRASPVPGFTYVRLPCTKDEVLSVTGPGDVRLLGRDACESRLRAEIGQRARWRAVHLACHGLVACRRPAWSCLALTPEGTDDGFLTVAEILDLGFAADLVVLSACESGLGREIPGEGLLGLSSTFLQSGATRVIASLWKVPDDASSALMSRFHELWRNGGVPAATALRRAQDHVRSHEKWKHARAWAGWVLWGAAD